MSIFSINNALPLPANPASQDWVFALLLGLFLLFVYTQSISTNWLTESVRTFFRVQERASIFVENNSNGLRSKIFMISFSLIVFALYTYTIMLNFELYNFIIILAIITVYYIVKRLISELIAYVFLEKSTMSIVRESYTNIVSYLGIILFPMLILQIYLPTQYFNTIEITTLIVCITAFLIFAAKLLLIFFHKKLAFFYIMLYLCTLEILPLFFLVKMLRALIQVV